VLARVINVVVPSLTISAVAFELVITSLPGRCHDWAVCVRESQLLVQFVLESHCLAERPHEAARYRRSGEAAGLDGASVCFPERAERRMQGDVHGVGVDAAVQAG